MVTIEITLLGGFAVVVDGRGVDERAWGRRHAAALVKLLALAPGHRLHREQLLDLLWPDDALDVAAPEAPQGRPLRPSGPGGGGRAGAAGRGGPARPRGDGDRRRRLLRGVGPAGPRRGGRRRRPVGPSPSTAVSCCPRTATRTGRRTAASSCGCATSSCCASTAVGRRSSTSTPATRSPTSPSCAVTPPAATAMRRCASSSASTVRCAGSSASLRAERPGSCAIGSSPPPTASRDGPTTAWSVGTRRWRRWSGRCSTWRPGAAAH